MTTFRDPSGEPAPAPMPSAERIRAGLIGASSSNGAVAADMVLAATPRQAGTSPAAGSPHNPFAAPMQVVPHVPPIRPEMEASLREVAQVDRPAGPGGRMLWLKRLILLLARPFAGRQAVFNERIQAALYEVSQRSLLTDQQLEHLVLARTQHLARQHAEAQQSIDHLQQQIQAMNQNFEAQLQAALHEQTTRLLQAISENATATIEETRENRQAFEALSREMAQRLDKTIADHSGLARQQVSDQIHTQFGHLREQQESLAQSAAATLSETAASLRAYLEQHADLAERLGKAIADHSGLVRQQVSDQIHTQFGHLREVFNGLEASVVAATSARLADAHGNSVIRAVDILDRAAQRWGEQATARMLQAIQQQQALLDRQLAAILTEESAALRGIVARVEEALARQTAPDAAEGQPPVNAPVGPASPNDLRGTANDLEYFQFELRMRGNPADIRQRQEKQIARLSELLGGLDGRRVLDVGSGTGIFVQLLTEAGAQAEGIDINRVSVDAGRALGRPVRCANAITDLRERPEASLHAITAFQVAEHLPEAVLREFVALAFRTLLPGGVILLETLNPRSLAAFRWYFMDLSHQHFLQPEALSHLVETAGFRDIAIHEYSTPPAWQRLNDDAPTDDATRQNFRLLNSVLFGPMEYCLVGRKPD